MLRADGEVGRENPVNRIAMHAVSSVVVGSAPERHCPRYLLSEVA
jgi:hypothetical protein